MPGVSDEQIRAAREIGLLAYLQTYEPHELKRDGRHYRTVTHGSLVVRNDGRWYWNRGGFGGVSALDFLIKMRGMGFVEAVETLCGARSSPSFSMSAAKNAQAAPEKPDFKLPPANRCGTHAVSYLQNRGISSSVISSCLAKGMFFPARYSFVEMVDGKPFWPSKEHVCTFVGFDDSGQPRAAFIRSIESDKRRDVSGSDKRYSFCYPAQRPGSKQVAVFEAPIDALSHATMQERDGWQWNGHRLSLGGTSYVALVSFLERHPEINRVILHLDNDRAGLVNARKIKALLDTDKRFSHIRVSVNPPHRGKDYNQDLQNRIRQERQLPHSRQKQAAVLL